MKQKKQQTTQYNNGKNDDDDDDEEEVRIFFLLRLGDECKLLMEGKCTVHTEWGSRLQN